MGRGFAEILSEDLQGSPQRYAIQFRTLHSLDAALGPRPFVPGISTERTAALVAGADEIVYGTYTVVNGVLRANIFAEDLARHKMPLAAGASGPIADGIFPVAGALARQFGETRPFGTRSEPALREYCAGLEAPNAAAAAQSFAAATAADPDFGRAWDAWLETAIQQHDRAAADHIVTQARVRESRFAALERAQFDLDAARLQGGIPAQIAALRDLARLDPSDPLKHRALAESLMSIRDLDAAIVEFRRTLTIRPDDVIALNMMGYAAAYAGDLPTAIRVLRGYEQLRPNDPNPLDSLGDVHFALGHFREAEQFYLAAYGKSAAFMHGGESLKAAQARLMTGDVKGATALFERFAAAREAAHDPAVPYHRATWKWQTGARRAAIADMDRLARANAAGPLHELAARADAQAVIWLLESGDRAGAAAHARQALAEAGPGTAGMAAMVATLALPQSPPLPANWPMADYARAYALLFDKQFARAAQVLQDLYHRPATGLDDGLSVLLAWAYAESGDWRRAQPLLRLTPLPEATGLPMFSSLYFPRIFYLRGMVLEREGQRAEAARYYELFRSLSGPDATT